MASLPLVRSARDDAGLVRRVAAGDESAFAAIDDRYRRPLIRHARSLLRRSDHDAEDVVQDVLARAHAAIRAGDGPQELRPWLYRLVRNRAIDEVRRARWGDAALDDISAAFADAGADPAAVISRREKLARLVEDLADLPVGQRTVLLARDVDGRAAADVAAELGITTEAAQMLAVRGRENLVRARDARDADCLVVRAEISHARERGVRATEHARRHVTGCAPCKAHERDLRRSQRRLKALAPPAGLLPAMFGGSKLLAGAGGTALVVAATGVTVLSTHHFRAGDPAPFRISGIRALVGHGVGAGQRLPAGTALVTATVRLAPGAKAARAPRAVTLACPVGTRVAGFQTTKRTPPLSYGFRDDTIIGHSTRARIVFDHTVLRDAATGVVGVLCRRPNAAGSLTARHRPLQAGERAARVCVRSAYLREEPGRAFVGTVYLGEPVAVQRRSASGRWALVVTDQGSRGWVEVAKLGLPRC